MTIGCFRNESGKLSFRICTDENLFTPKEAQRLGFQLETVFSQLSSSTSETRVRDLDCLSEHDKETIWSWNCRSPRRIDATIPELIRQQSARTRNRVAVDAWDGRITYKELQLRSDALALWLLKKKIAVKGQILPVCFDKTLWTTVVILAIAKSGAIFLLLDPHQPLGRLKAIMLQTGAAALLTRPESRETAESLHSDIVVINEDCLDNSADTSSEQLQSLPLLKSSDHLYVVFTSGSTGAPKGAILSHGNLCSAVTHQARALGFSGQRTLDSSSYSFDAYVFNTFYTILTGGTLCVPSESDRINSLPQVLQTMQIQYLQLTPSVARLVDPAKLPLLETLLLTGEKITKTVLQPWLATNRIRVINAYGPSECTIMCAANRNLAHERDIESIGFGLGSTLWISDAKDITRLAPVGTIGELLIEGPIVGQGYLGKDNEISESLIQPSFNHLTGVFSEPCKLMFRTRDLARYNDDGSIVYIGRADTQIKINGQRVEVGEVEYHLNEVLSEGAQGVVETVQWPSDYKQLVAFVRTRAGPSMSKPILKKLITGLLERMLSRIPQYMIPSGFISINDVPMTLSGKVDRKKLRQLALENPGQVVNIHDLNQYPQVDRSMDQGVSEEERLLQGFWASALNLSQDAIGSHDNFFSTGGDSLAAMRLVSNMKNEGFDGIDVATVFQYPQLAELARLMHKNQEASQAVSSEVSPYSLLNLKSFDLEYICESAARACGCTRSEIEDIYPCASIQEDMMALSAYNPDIFLLRESSESTIHNYQDIYRHGNKWSAPMLSFALVSLTSNACLMRVRRYFKLSSNPVQHSPTTRL